MVLFGSNEGPWKRKTLIEFGIQNQCLSTTKIDELYLINVLLKINMKVFNLVLFLVLSMLFLLILTCFSLYSSVGLIMLSSLN